MIGILMLIFPSRRASVNAYTEMCSGLGYMFGPALGSFLYIAGGFGLPFYVVGALILSTAVSLLFLIPKIDAKEATAAKEAAIGKSEGTEEKPSLGMLDVIKVSA